MTPDTPLLIAAVGPHLVVHAIGPEGELSRTGDARAAQPIQHATTAARGARIYLACSDGGIGRAGTRHSLDVFELDAQARPRQAGSLALSQRPLHVAVDAENARVHLAFNRPSAYACVVLDAHGRPAAIEHHACGPDVTGWFAHQVLPVAAARVLLVCRGDDAGADAPEHPGSLRLLSRADGEVRVSQCVAPGGGLGFGPRNGALSPDGRFLYVVLERQNRLVVFPYAGGRLAAAPSFDIATLSRAPSQSVRQFAGDIGLHPSGRFAYVLNRSRDPRGENSVATFSINPATGEPRHVDTLALPGMHPRTVRLSDDGRWMAVAVMEPDAARAVPAGVSLLTVDDGGRPRHRRHWTPPEAREPVTWATLCPSPS